MFSRFFDSFVLLHAFQSLNVGDRGFARFRVGGLIGPCAL